MGLVRGDNAIVYIDNDGSGSSERRVVGCFRSATLDVSSEMIETSITGQGKYATFIPSKQSFGATLEGLLYIDKEGIKFTSNELLEAQANETLLSVDFEYTDDSGNFMNISATFYLESHSITNSFDNITTFSVTLKGTGALLIETGS